MSLGRFRNQVVKCFMKPSQSLSSRYLNKEFFFFCGDYIYGMKLNDVRLRIEVFDTLIVWIVDLLPQTER